MSYDAMDFSIRSSNVMFKFNYLKLQNLAFKASKNSSIKLFYGEYETSKFVNHVILIKYYLFVWIYGN
ncbi:hypothetical protein H311_00251 [Anncaliia algerae PRA109]|nr:hypothetical protein H311_00251 [Anncaliia algerae PRA109]